MVENLGWFGWRFPVAALSLRLGQLDYGDCFVRRSSASGAALTDSGAGAGSCFNLSRLGWDAALAFEFGEQ
jgi:hypothetical protein